MSLFSRLFYKPIPIHTPAKKWHVPLAWHPNLEIRYTLTVWDEDLPKNCFDCGSVTLEEGLEPICIEGSLQFMRRVCYCPKGCGFTVWFA